MSPSKVDFENDKAPPFGHAMKALFSFDEGYVNLNHGSYGSVPLHVTAVANELNSRLECNPDMLMRCHYSPIVIKSREAVAKLLGADVDEVVFVANASMALNTVLHNFEWREGDLLIGVTTPYVSASKTGQFLADRSEAPRPTAHALQLVFPMTHQQIVDAFRTKLRALRAAYPDTAFTDVPPLSAGVPSADAGEARRQNKIVAVIDSIARNPGDLLPWQEMVTVCREEGVWSVIDGAHNIGPEPGINLSEAQPDFYTTNCYKWWYTKRPCTVLYVPKRNQGIMESSLPTAHGYVSPSSPAFKEVGMNFVNQNAYTGAVDPIPFATVTDAIAFREWIGGEHAINTYCHQLALDGGARLAELLGTRAMDPNGELTVSTTNVLLPLPVEAPSATGTLYTPALRAQIDALFRERLLFEWKTYAPHYFHGGGWWCRCSAQVFNEISDFEYIAMAFDAICKEIKSTLLPAETQA